jgi:hypothetical protein
MTNYKDGLASYGLPVLPKIAEGGYWGDQWFVDGNEGSDKNNGKSRDKPMLTMEQAFDVVRSGDTIHLRGNVREQLTTPHGVYDVTIVGPSPVTRHPDANTASETYGGQRAARWNAPATPTDSVPLLEVRQQGWRILNILFTGDEDDNVGCIQLIRTAEGADEKDASHAWIQGCRFQAGLYGIQDSGGCARVKIYDNEFMLFDQSDNDAIISVVGAGIGTMFGWDIIGNKFHANHTDIDIAASGPRIMYNEFMLNSLGVTNTIAIDITGGSEERVAFNGMYCASDEASVVDARFTASSTPFWGPNYYTDVEEYGEPSE